MTIPNSFLPPPSQPWGRWVVDSIRRLASNLSRFEQDTGNNLRQLNITQRQPMRAMLWRQSSTAVTITNAGVYVPINAAGTLDSEVTFNMGISSAPNVTGVKNITEQTRTVVIVATYDGRGGNNQAMGLKLALNGEPIDATECRSFAGSSGQFGKTMTQWMLRLEPGDEVTMLAANIDTTDNLTIARYKMLAHAIQ